MSAVERLFANLKRLLEPRTPPPAERIGQPTADRPPPPAEALPSRAEVAPSPEPASQDVIPPDGDLTEVRALLESVAEADPTPTLAPASTPTLFPAEIPVDEDISEGEVVDAPVPRSDLVGDALVLSLGTPPVTFTVAKTSATLGRGQENSIRLDDLSVSRRHARIAYRQGGYWLRDLGSMGGTWVDGTRLNAPRRIAAGEVIDIGLCRLTVSFGGGVAKADTKKSASNPQETAAQVRRRR